MTEKTMKRRDLLLNEICKSKMDIDDKLDLESKKEPTYDTVVSMPMLMNKSASGFTIVLPIHTYFNSMQKFNIGVPWKNLFRVQVIGRYK